MALYDELELGVAPGGAAAAHDDEDNDETDGGATAATATAPPIEGEDGRRARRHMEQGA